MLYAILCYNSEDVVGSWTKEEDDAVMARLGGRAGEAGQSKAGSGRSPACCRPPRRPRCARAASRRW